MTLVRTVRTDGIWNAICSLTTWHRYAPWKSHRNGCPGSQSSLHLGLRLCLGPPAADGRASSHPPSTPPRTEAPLLWPLAPPAPKVSWVRIVRTPGAATSPRLVQRCRVSQGERQTRRRKGCTAAGRGCLYLEQSTGISMSRAIPGREQRRGNVSSTT